VGGGRSSPNLWFSQPALSLPVPSPVEGSKSVLSASGENRRLYYNCEYSRFKVFSANSATLRETGLIAFIDAEPEPRLKPFSVPPVSHIHVVNGTTVGSGSSRAQKASAVAEAMADKMVDKLSFHTFLIQGASIAQNVFAEGFCRGLSPAYLLVLGMGCTKTKSKRR